MQLIAVDTNNLSGDFRIKSVLSFNLAVQALDPALDAVIWTKIALNGFSQKITYKESPSEGFTGKLIPQWHSFWTQQAVTSLILEP